MPFTLIAITPEKAAEGEVERICTLIDTGFSYIHIRKPSFSEQETADYILSIPTKYRNRLKLHDWHHLAEKYGLAGIHLTGRSSNLPKHYTGEVSISCHSLSELHHISGFNYAFLSPIFDSISKQGYKAGFSLPNLLSSHLITDSIVALGGMTAERIAQVKHLGFGGCAFLGYLFDANKTEFSERIEQIIKQLQY